MNARTVWFWRIAIGLGAFILLATLVMRIVEQERTIATLQQQKALEMRSADQWRDLASRFEQLNRECVALCAPDQMAP